MKNSEWGAVSYLTQSSYGRSRTEVKINDSGTNYYTGGGTGTTYATNYTNQSSTGNPTGIYDLRGNAWEYVAAYITNGNASLSTYGSSFVNTIANTNPTTVSTEYSTAYPYSGTTEASNRSNFKNNYAGTRYGDSIIETGTMTSTTGAWNSGYSYFPNSTFPFFLRGGLYDSGSSAGVFSFSYGSGNGASTHGFRAC